MPKYVKKEEDYEPHLNLISETDPAVLWRKAKPLDLRPKTEGEMSKDYVICRSGINSEVSNALLRVFATGAHDPDAAGQCVGSSLRDSILARSPQYKLLPLLVRNKNGSYFEKFPDHSGYFMRANGHERLKNKGGSGWGRRGFHWPKVYFNVHLLPDDLRKEVKEEDD
ncbi:hypothetical protein M407DRAFT_10527 [Tulasnella calospora MUT 4182]|uniref:Uncharacterized protein n=1 Tax=Tulasnella calospora MUT 4182 TaxID=1051891 RepID=A0A0C3QAK4_9AGAM|nr:hypothetical protein M407DRAFT_10527 [Tulasnella calospora MUT 4182]